LNYSWDEKAYKYKIAEPAATGEVNELEQYVFVVRVRVGKRGALCNSFYF